ncbi:CCDC162P [Bugula neritina]|uniref:CCDC162P n=1 Tax=Bugula neritina TaxID=10212 RepID=A0A7J7KQ81_BUGNE|nr:CCDC162P [Bugula neritina]
MLWQSHRIEHHLQTCLCGLKDVDRHVANGEILGVSLLLEDILQSGNQDSSTFVALVSNSENEDTKSKKSNSRPASSYSMVSAGRSSHKSKPSSISRTKQPIEAYELLKHFLILWKSTEVLKLDWSLRKLQVNKIDTPQLHRLMSKEYKEHKLLPTLQSIARRTGHSDMYEGITHETEPLTMPPNVSEIEVKAAQLLKLIESLEDYMIQETTKKLTKDLNLAFAERGREESALPTDLWKRPVSVFNTISQFIYSVMTL